MAVDHPAHHSEFRRWSGGVDHGICQTFAASPAEPGELPLGVRANVSLCVGTRALRNRPCSLDRAPGWLDCAFIKSCVFAEERPWKRAARAVRLFTRAF